MDHPQRSEADPRREGSDEASQRDTNPEEGRGAPGPRESSETSERPKTGASFAEQIGDPSDLAEFDDLLDSLRDAMRTADEARAAAAASRPSSRPPEPALPDSPGSEDEWEGTVPDAAAEPVAEYPEWLTNGSGFDEEEEAPGLMDEVEKRFGMPRRRHVYRSYESSRISAHAIRCRVTISSNGHEFVGVADGPSVPGVRAEIAAKATLDALSAAEDGKIVLSLMAARVLRFTDLPLVVVSVYGMSDEEVNRLVGVSMVENSEEQAAILATLQATDRWIAGVIGRYWTTETPAASPASDDEL